MHFGLPKKSFLSQWGIIFSFVILTCITFGCKDEKDISLSFSAPEQGQNFNAGDEIKIQLDAAKDAKISSVVYLIDSTIISTKTNTYVWKYLTDRLVVLFLRVGTGVGNGARQAVIAVSALQYAILS